MLKRLQRFVLIGLCLLFVTPQGRAWNDTGHRLIALIAYDGLDEVTRARLLEVLRAHPRFQQDFLDEMPSTVQSDTQEQRDRWLFAQGAIWPDIARGFSGKLLKEHHHTTWHYVNLPIYMSEDDEQQLADDLLVNLRVQWTAGMRSASMNIVQALQKSIEWLNRNDASVGDSDKAIYLCWMLHLVGDIHQPMHASAMFSEARFPVGDRGGNSIKLDGGKSLHSFWDGTLGSAKSIKTLASTAKSLRGNSDITSKAAKAAIETSFESWMNESHQLAEVHVYTEEVRTAIEDADDSEDGTAFIGELPASYSDEAEQVSRQQAANAGFRLARALASLNP